MDTDEIAQRESSAAAAIGFDFEGFGDWLDSRADPSDRRVTPIVASAHHLCADLGCLPEHDNPWTYATHMALGHGMDPAMARQVATVLANGFAKAKLRVRVHGLVGS